MTPKKLNFEQYQQEEDEFRFIRTTIGLLGFIIFFLGAFCAFIVAGELEKYYEAAIVLGVIALAIMTMFFCCVMRESKRAYDPLTPPQEMLEMKRVVSPPELPVEPQPEPQQQPFWGDKDRDDPEYVRQVLGLKAGDTDETTDFENDPDSDLQALQELGRTGAIAEGKESIDEPTYEELDYTKAGPSNVAYTTSVVIESRADVSSLKCLSTLSLSDTTEKPAENVSAALSKLSLDDSEKQAAEVAEEDPSTTHSEDVSHEQQTETSKHAKDVKPTKSE